MPLRLAHPFLRSWLPAKLVLAGAFTLCTHTPCHAQGQQSAPATLPCESAQVSEERVTLALLKQCSDANSAEAMFQLFEKQRLIDKEQAKQWPRQVDTGDVFRKRQINELAWAVQFILRQASQPGADSRARNAASALLQGKAQSALDELARSTDTPALTLRAMAALQRTLDLNASAGTLAKALELNPKQFGLLQAAADVAHIQKKAELAEKLYQRLVAQAKETLAGQPQDPFSLHQLATALDDLGDAQAELNQMTQALGSYQAALEIWQARLKEQAEYLLWQVYTAQSWQKLGSIQYEQGQFSASGTSLQAAQALYQKLALTHAQAGNQLWASASISNSIRLGDTQLRAKQHAAALASYKTGLAIAAKLNASAPKEAQWQRDLATIYQRMGDLYQFQHQGEQAMAQYNAALMLRQRLAGPNDDDNPVLQGQIIFIENRLADLQSNLGLPDAALSNYQAALALATHLANKVKVNEFKLVQANLMGKIGLLEGSTLKDDERRAMLKEGIALLEADPSNLPNFLSELLEKMRTAIAHPLP